MDRYSCIEKINSKLNSQALLAKRNEFKEKFGNQFESFFEEVDFEIAKLHSSTIALRLSLLDTLPDVLISKLRALSPDDKGFVAKELVARSLTRLTSFIEASALPLSIIQQYPVAVGYIVNSLILESEAFYGDETESYFDRDLRMASGFTIPAGAQIVDLRCWLPRSFYRFQGMKENLRCLLFVRFQLGGLGPLFRIHTDTRNLVDFNESGWNDCYARIVELLEVMPEVKGMVGTSWFYDPQLEKISPKLDYLCKIPMGGGAFLRIDGSGDVHTERAISRSPTRKRLYEEGKFLPVCATLIWSKKDIVRWLKRSSK